jgi:hypothetical protein
MNFTIFTLCLISIGIYLSIENSIAGGMSFLCIVGVGVYLAIRRGRTTVRAAMYLIYLGEGFSPEDSNNATQGTGYADAGKFQDQLIAQATAPFGGSQLQMIAKARSMGFKE